MTKVSIITPTYNRERFLSRILNCVLSQTYHDLEWLILDDSPAPSSIVKTLNAPNIFYEHTTQRLSIGEKRNRLVERAAGSIIIHFDDDDYYAPNYVDTVLEAFQKSEADLLNLRGWFLYDERNEFFGYWNLMIKKGVHYRCGPKGLNVVTLSGSEPEFQENHMGWGFGWVYRKSVWNAVRFAHKDWNEDGEFALKAREKFKLEGIVDLNGICLHFLHPSSTSVCLPQFHLPNFMVQKLFSV